MAGDYRSLWLLRLGDYPRCNAISSLPLLSLSSQEIPMLIGAEVVLDNDGTEHRKGVERCRSRFLPRIRFRKARAAACNPEPQDSLDENCRKAAGSAWRCSAP